MKVPLSWLKDFLPLDLSAEEIGEKLTLLGIEVENISGLYFSFEGVVVGQVLSTTRHPHADRLQVARVTDGTNEYQVVCGASNCRAGLIVAFAKIGASLKDAEQKPGKIKKSTIRDVESQGMLCSSLELGLGVDSEGIMELPTDWVLGTDLASFYIDPVFEISLTPNLGHCLSVLGIARELGAALGVRTKRPDFCIQKTEGPLLTKTLSVDVKNRELCSRYALRAIRNVTVGPSPAWVAKKLEACGLRSVNNVVDVGNLVMLELGQPLHIFDADKIAGETLSVCEDSGFSSLRTLDEKEHSIPPHALMICDRDKPLAFAGVMGGFSSAVSASTKNILLEAAIFKPSSIRKTSRSLDVRSESSYRFERGVDPNGIPLALDRACFLIQQIAGGEIIQGMIDSTEEKFLPKKIICRPSRVNALLGTHLSTGEMISLLERLEMHVSEDMHVSVPTYRTDITTEIDLIEEIARIFGYNHLPKKPPYYTASSVLDTPLYLFEKETLRYLLQEGLQECITCDLISPTLAKLTMEKGLLEDATISVLHPRSVDQSVLRTSLLPGLLQVVKLNASHQIEDLSVCEIGKVHFKEGSAFKEQPCAALILTGKKSPLHWDNKSQDFDFFDLKGIVLNLLKSLGIREPVCAPSHFHTLHPGRQAQLKIGKQLIGVIGEVHPEILESFGLDKKVFFGELNLYDLLVCRKKDKKCHKLPSFPGSARDWTLSLKREAPIGQLFESIEKSKPPVLEHYALIDVFTGEKLGQDKKNATLRFLYRAPEKTLSFEEIEQAHQSLIQAVTVKLEAFLA